MSHFGSVALSSSLLLCPQDKFPYSGGKFHDSQYGEVIDYIGEGISRAGHVVWGSKAGVEQFPKISPAQK